MKFDPQRFRNPELILSDLLRSAAVGEIVTAQDNPMVLHRAIVMAVDQEGGRLQNEVGAGDISVTLPDGHRRSYPASIGPTNPRGSIRARILTRAFDRLEADDRADVFWPLFSSEQLSLPISVGEHVYVMFEDGHFEHGLWISRVSGHDAANNFPGAQSYDFPTGRRSAMTAFEGDSVDYPQEDDFAGEAPRSAMDAFGD